VPVLELFCTSVGVNLYSFRQKNRTSRLSFQQLDLFGVFQIGGVSLIRI
jgi:hypothetical protein